MNLSSVYTDILGVEAIKSSCYFVQCILKLVIEKVEKSKKVTPFMPNIHYKCRKQEQDIQKMKMTFKVGSDHLISLYI